MTVRWKPLLILSGVFSVVAVVGVIAMAWSLVPRSAQGILKQARTAAAAGRFDDAVIYFKQALQYDARAPRSMRNSPTCTATGAGRRPPIVKRRSRRSGSITWSRR